MSADHSRPTRGLKLKPRFRKVRATEATRNSNLLDNAAIAELFIREVETASEHRRLAFKRAARAAFIIYMVGRSSPSCGRRKVAHRARRDRSMACQTVARLVLVAAPRLSTRHQFVASFSRSLKPAGPWPTTRIGITC